ncbi:MAG: zf-TFIIB domain-containing protein [Nannocystaceae bacterium]|nr:zf-TFIIB domain-containing protein [Nannocystaceae bacterium]
MGGGPMQHPARPRYCPTCGGPNPSPTAIACRFCDGPLVALGQPDPRDTVVCSSCHSAMPGGATFCCACGEALASLQDLPAPGPCPHCQIALCGWGLAPTAARPSGHPLASCERCGGVWLPAPTRQALIDDAARAAAARGDVVASEVVRRQLPTGTLTQAVKYRRCPSCAQPMARKNFGGCSGVLVDECRCGTFFDAGELEDTLAFVRSGGLQLARKRADEERTRAMRLAESAAMSAQAHSHTSWPPAQADLSLSLVGWLGRWIARAFS